MSKTNCTITINPYLHKDSTLSINQNQAQALGLLKKKRAYVSFGTAKIFVDIELNKKLPEDVILISQNVINDLHLPDYVPYEIRVQRNEILIGPYIGMLITDDGRNISTVGLDRRMESFVKEYDLLHGAFVVFALNQVDIANRLIEGYCYYPGKSGWIKEICPYPSAIYRTIGLSDAWQNHFLTAIGDRFFNRHYFNKWDMYQWFSADPEIEQHLPHTVLYQSYEDISRMMQKFSTVFIKPISGLKGHGIVKVSMENEAIAFHYREKGKNYKILTGDPNEIKEFAESRFRPERYLIQQGIHLLEHNGSILDFRCAVQKDLSAQWKCNAVIGRYGDPGSIVSNISSGGTTYAGIDLLAQTLTVSPSEILKITHHMKSLAVRVCNTLDEFGLHCATLGLDIGIDVNGHLWLIEINNRDPSPRYALDLNDPKLYRAMKTSPLLYAKALAGFGTEE